MADEVGSGISQETRTTLIDHNRLNDDMCEAAALVNPCFLVNSVMDTNGDFARIVAGHWYDAWLEGTKEVMKIQGVKVKGQADVVIASPGGFPKDINLYQALKPMIRQKWHLNLAVSLFPFWKLVKSMIRLNICRAFISMM